MNYYRYGKALLVAALLVINTLFTTSAKEFSQDNPVLVPDVPVIPVVDGKMDDSCWQNIPWQSIDNVWIPYNGSVTSADYSGHYKIVWSSQTNLLYFLIEVTDDVYVDGYVPGVTADIYNFDITEVFIDENKSGGEHRYDGNNSNAENAFAYHMYAPFPQEGAVTTVPLVDDMAGTTSNSKRIDYSSHFPDYALRKTGNTAVFEFSLIVYNDTYTDANKDAARVILTPDKLMGLSVAYCDNDNKNENPKVRDNMFGSVSEPSPGNLHWQNANYFGSVKLVTDIPTDVEGEQITHSNTTSVYPNPAASSSNLYIEDSYRGEISIKLYNILGEEVFHISAYKTSSSFTKTLTWNSLPSGIYILKAQSGSTITSKKLIITNR